LQSLRPVRRVAELGSLAVMRVLKVTLLITLAAVVGCCGLVRFNRPFGFRTCFLPCTVSALRLYAHDNSGRYPDSPDPFAALQKLYPEPIHDPKLLAGISGDREATARLLMMGGRLTSNESSWVYIPGLSASNEATTILIYERRRGLAFNGARASGRAVGFVDGSHRQMPEHEFQQLLQTQQNDRRSKR